MDTVLGLSVTPTTVGWVLAEGHGADGAILDHRELVLQDSLHDGFQDGPSVRAVITAEQVAAEVLRARDVATAENHRLRMVGVTWSDDAAAQAALLQEALTDDGFDNVVPVRMLDAVETLAQAIAPVIGYERTAVCILEHEWATVVMVDTFKGETQTAVKHVRGGYDGLTSWLTGMFDRSTWRPAGVVVVGNEDDVSDFCWRLENLLPVPVFAQTMAQVTVARGAALVAAQSTEFTDAELVAMVDEDVDAAVAPTRSRQYAGAATTLAAAAITFVASVSLAVGLQLAPGRDSETAAHIQRTPTPQVAEAVAPAPPPAVQPQPQEPVRLAADEQTPESLPAAPPSGTVPAPEPATGPFLLSRAIENLPGTFAESGRPPE